MTRPTARTPVTGNADQSRNMGLGNGCFLHVSSTPGVSTEGWEAARHFFPLFLSFLFFPFFVFPFFPFVFFFFFTFSSRVLFHFFFTFFINSFGFFFSF